MSWPPSTTSRSNPLPGWRCLLRHLDVEELAPASRCPTASEHLLSRHAAPTTASAAHLSCASRSPDDTSARISIWRTRAVLHSWSRCGSAQPATERLGGDVPAGVAAWQQPAFRRGALELAVAESELCGASTRGRFGRRWRIRGGPSARRFEAARATRQARVGIFSSALAAGAGGSVERSRQTMRFHRRGSTDRSGLAWRRRPGTRASAASSR
jgi:hypothetical protein